LNHITLQDTYKDKIRTTIAEIQNFYLYNGIDIKVKC